MCFNVDDATGVNVPEAGRLLTASSTGVGTGDATGDVTGDAAQPKANLPEPCLGKPAAAAAAIGLGAATTGLDTAAVGVTTCDTDDSGDGTAAARTVTAGTARGDGCFGAAPHAEGEAATGEGYLGAAPHAGPPDKGRVTGGGGAPAASSGDGDMAGSMLTGTSCTSEPDSQSAAVHTLGTPATVGGKSSASLSKDDLSERGTSTRAGMTPRLHSSSTHTRTPPLTLDRSNKRRRQRLTNTRTLSSVRSDQFRSP
jgi:hypothetical protein